MSSRDPWEQLTVSIEPWYPRQGMRVRQRDVLRAASSTGVRLRTTARRSFANAVVAGLLAAALIAPREARAQCVDDELKQELVGGRHYRGVEDRLFTKAFRHELSAMGGLYAADLYSSSWVVGGAYTFHFSEDLALEASVEFTRFHSAVTDAYERRYPNDPDRRQPGQARAAVLRSPRLVVCLRQAALDGRRHQPVRLQLRHRRRRDR